MACHPLPTLAVTVVGGALGGAVGLSAGRLLVLVAAILTGQLSIGWSNDVLDAERDRRSGRTDKPLAVGSIDRRTATLATGIAVLLAVAFALALGGWAGGAALSIVACGWAYNLGLRSTVLSFLPYAIAFGALPAVATLALPTAPLPAWWAVAAGSMLGVGAHLLNVLPDLEQDAANGIRGLPHRLGPGPSTGCAVLLVLGAAAALLFGPVGPVPPWRWIAFGAMVAGAAGVAVLQRRGPAGRWLFKALIVGAAIDVVLFAVSGTGMTTGS